ncbi:hypothetical protein LCGC14_2896640, partial [marine sediment metagenome]
MPRRREPFTLIKRPGSPYWYFKLGPWTCYKSTGKKLKSEAMEVALRALKSAEDDPGGPT